MGGGIALGEGLCSRHRKISSLWFCGVLGVCVGQLHALGS
jgi:hypothetical protein